MMKAIPTLLLLLFATGGVLSHSSVDALDANISISPLNPIGFTKFMLYLVSLPFRLTGMIFNGMFGVGGSMMGAGSGTEVGESNGVGIIGRLYALPRRITHGVARFIEEIFHFVRVYLDTIFGHLEGGAAVIAGDGSKSQSNRDVRSNNATRAEAAQAG